MVLPPTTLDLYSHHIILMCTNRLYRKFFEMVLSEVA
jgi:hypothetical protein